MLKMIMTRAFGGAGRCAAAAADETRLVEDAERVAAASRKQPEGPLQASSSGAASSAASRSSSEAVARRLTAKGHTLLISDRLEDAHEVLSSAVEANERFGESSLWLGICEIKMRRYEAALASLDAADRHLIARATRLQKKRKHATSDSAATGSAVDVGSAVVAAAAVSAGGSADRQLMELAAMAAFEAGNALYVVGRASDAEAQWRRAARRNPKHAEATSNLGVIR